MVLIMTLKGENFELEIDMEGPGELRPPFSVDFGEPDLSLWNWERQAPQEKAPAAAEAAWEDTGGTGHAYVPSEADAGKRLRVTCTPRGRAAPGASPGAP